MRDSAFFCLTGKRLQTIMQMVICASLGREEGEAGNKGGEGNSVRQMDGCCCGGGGADLEFPMR